MIQNLYNIDLQQKNCFHVKPKYEKLINNSDRTTWFFSWSSLTHKMILCLWSDDEVNKYNLYLNYKQIKNMTANILEAICD